MAKYSPKKRRATKKRRLKKSVEEDKRVSRRKPKKLKKTAARARAVKKKTRAISRRSSKKVAAKKRPLPPKRAKVKAKARTRTKVRAKSKASSKRRVKVKAKVKAKTLAKRKKPKTAAQKRTARRKQLEKELAALRKEEKANRGAKRRSPRRKRQRELKAKVEETRIAAIISPQAAAAERKQALDERWKKLRARRNELLRLAQASDELPSTNRPKRRIDSANEIGQQRLVRVERWLDARNIESIIEQVRRAGEAIRGGPRQERNLWSARLTMSAIGERLFGSGDKLFQGTDEDAPLVQTQGYDTTGVFSVFDNGTVPPGYMMASFRSLLEEWVRAERSMVYLHSVLVRNFNRRRAVR